MMLKIYEVMLGEKLGSALNILALQDSSDLSTWNAAMCLDATVECVYIIAYQLLLKVEEEKNH